MQIIMGAERTDGTGMSDDVTIRYPRPGLRVEEWAGPSGKIREIKVIPEEYEHETREEWAERLGLDISLFQRKTNNETPKEKAERIKREAAEYDAYLKEIGWSMTEEEQAEVDAVLKRMGLPTSDSEEESE